MGRRSASNQQYLPSMLDRISDDSFFNRNLLSSRKKVKALENKLNQEGAKVEPEVKKQWLEALAEHRNQVNYLQQSVGSLTELRDCVKRDLGWLFNSHNLNLEEEQKECCPEVESSVVNYGMPDLTGRTASSINIHQLERNIKETILRFEPRIIPKTLKVQLRVNEIMMNHNSLMFEIKGDLWAEPVPIQLQLMTQVDLENGTVEVKDM